MLQNLFAAFFLLKIKNICAKLDERGGFVSMDSVILHCDCNAFFASVEELYHPEYKNVPMAICGDPNSRHGIILAKNEHAKAYGIQTAETLWSAKQKCPSLVLAPARRGAYSECSKAINKIYNQYTDQVEPFSIDESFLDITGSLRLFKKTGYELANEIRHRVEKEIGITISVGLSFCKIFAKLGSDYKKPNATTEITRSNFQKIVWPLPVGTMMMVGPKLVEQLNEMGIYTLGELATTDIEILSSRFGKHGVQLFEYANGIDPSVVLPTGSYTPAKSIGNGMTFKRDILNEKEALIAIRELSETVVERMRQKGQMCTQVQITVRYNTMKTFTRQTVLPNSTWLIEDLSSTAHQLLLAHWNGKPIRMITITAGGLIAESERHEQTSFFEMESLKNERTNQLEDALFRIKNKYGKKSIQNCTILDDNLDLF